MGDNKTKVEYEGSEEIVFSDRCCGSTRTVLRSRAIQPLIGLVGNTSNEIAVGGLRKVQHQLGPFLTSGVVQGVRLVDSPPGDPSLSAALTRKSQEIRTTEATH